MKQYFDSEGKLLGVAHDARICWAAKNEEHHDPHLWHPLNPGTLLCAGFPATYIYDQPPRKPVNK